MHTCPRCERSVPLDKAGRFAPHPKDPRNPARCGAGGHRPKSVRQLMRSERQAS